MNRMWLTLPALLCMLDPQPAPAALLLRPALDGAPPTRGLPVGMGPCLGRLPLGSPPVAGTRVAGETYVDLPCDVFDPGKADPLYFMASSTVARVTYDGIHDQYGYDPMGQTYDAMVSGLADYSGIVVQETVGILAAQIPATLKPADIRRVEIWFLVSQSNLYPSEGVGFTDLSSMAAPSSGLDELGMQSLYSDGRGFSGEVYYLDHFDPGPHAVDLGQRAVTDFAARIDGPGWFGVGMAADGWDLSGSLGQMVFWKVAGGGGLPEGNRPFFRVYYNAPPDPFALLSPADASEVLQPQPTLSWQTATDPNGDTPLRYTVRVGTDPKLISALSLDADTATSTTLPLPLSPGDYVWQVVARDPGGATRSSALWSFTVTDPTTGSPTPPVLAAGRLLPVPNPFNPRTELRFHLNEGQSLRLWIADTRGRHVRTLWSGWMSAGDRAVRWDGTDGQGRPCASGMYLGILDAAGERATARLLLVR